MPDRKICLNPQTLRFENKSSDPYMQVIQTVVEAGRALDHAEIVQRSGLIPFQVTQFLKEATDKGVIHERSKDGRKIWGYDAQVAV